MPLENSGYTFTEGVLADGDTLQVTIEGSTTKANTSVENVVTKVKVTRGEEDVTFNYSFGEHEKGTLTVTKRKVTIESKSYDFDYDSSAHSYPYYDITFGSFVNGEGFDYKSWASVTDYSDEAVKNIFEVEAWVDTDKNNYDIKCEYGDLRIKKVSTPIVVTANSNSKPYDGTPLTDEGYTFTENVLKGADELTAKVEGSITDFSATPEENVVTEVKVYRKISAEEKVEVSQNYNLEQRISGKLRINKCNVTFTSGSTS